MGALNPILTMKLKIIQKKEVDQSWTIGRIMREYPPDTWGEAFAEALPDIEGIPGGRGLDEILAEDEAKYGMYYPLKKDIFNAFRLTPLNKVRVIIIGQDPYHQTLPGGDPRAVGMSFSVRKSDAIPSSLNNIYKELQNTVHGFEPPNHGDLSEWAQQGVLMLNTCLSVRPGQAGSHGDIWMGFVTKMLRKIAEVRPKAIFLLWGRHAQKLQFLLDSKAIILEAAHPSGLSARRGFFGCNHFRQVNDILISMGEAPINWQISPVSFEDTTEVKLDEVLRD